MIKFGVSFMYSSYLCGSGKPTLTSMESIRVIHAKSYDEAKKIALKIGLKNEHAYKNMDDIEVRWMLHGLRVYEISDSNEKNAEVFSRFMDEKCKAMLLVDYDEVFSNPNIDGINHN